MGLKTADSTGQKLNRVPHVRKRLSTNLNVTSSSVKQSHGSYSMVQYGIMLSQRPQRGSPGIVTGSIFDSDDSTSVVVKQTRDTSVVVVHGGRHRNVRVVGVSHVIVGSHVTCRVGHVTCRVTHVTVLVRHVTCLMTHVTYLETA